MSQKDNNETKRCLLCPRRCAVDRTGGMRGYCGETDRVRVARASLHTWEEPCISGDKGSGTVFFTGCSLHCIFCQNAQIENGKVGKILDTSELADVFLRLQARGANNINLVTPGHFSKQIAAALCDAKKNGLTVPIVYNSSGYESMETLSFMDGLVDIYLPDLKYTDSVLSGRFSHAPDYFSYAKEAISEMVRQTGVPSFVRTKDGKQMNAEIYNECCDFGDEILLKRGTIVRHLLLPGQTKDTKKVLSYLHETYGNNIFVSIMNQYTPMDAVRDMPELNRRVTQKEYDEVVNYALSLGMENAFIQEGDTASESFIPEFDLEGLEY